ncbi:MAG: transposase, partial [Candidatus Moranbacteria bacterium]|nr:transposase [Candidatus Moranbacteria bacterium]
NLTEWLIEYNFNRPHQALDYLTPIEFTQKYSRVSKMYSSNTIICQNQDNDVYSLNGINY